MRDKMALKLIPKNWNIPTNIHTKCLDELAKLAKVQFFSVCCEVLFSSLFVRETNTKKTSKCGLGKSITFQSLCHCFHLNISKESDVRKGKRRNHFGSFRGTEYIANEYDAHAHMQWTNCAWNKREEKFDKRNRQNIHSHTLSTT